MKAVVSFDEAQVLIHEARVRACRWSDEEPGPKHDALDDVNYWTRYVAETWPDGKKPKSAPA